MDNLGKRSKLVATHHLLPSMSYKKGIVYAANPTTLRGSSTKLSSHGNKLVYASGRTIVIRDLQDPGKNIVYTGHRQPTSVARLSPSGYYCASADTAGTVRVWDIVGEENILKIENKAISGPIKDLTWDGESKRILAVGEGRERFGNVFMIDTGSSAGEISGHSKVVNAVSTRPQRPFRAVTASDDGTIVFYQGPPYRYDKSIKTHTKFVQDVRYAPSGDAFVSVGSDAKIFLYDGKTGDMTADLGEGLHSGTIFAASWSSDSEFFATSSADRTVKYFDASAQKAISSWTVGPDLSDQQCGNVWVSENEIASVSVGGDINVFDKRTGDGPSRILCGPTKGVTAAAVDASGTFFAGSYDGRVVSVTANGTVEPISGSSHSNHVSGIAVTGKQAYSIGYDDTIRQFTTGQFSNAALSTAGQPKGIAANQTGVAFVVTTSGIDAFSEGKKLSHQSTSYTPSSVAVNENLVAVGGEDEKVYLYSWDGSKLTQKSEKFENNRGQVSALAFSPDGALLAAGDSGGKIFVYDVAEKALKISRWAGHTARINAISFHPSGQFVVSGSLDTNLYIWSVEKPLKKLLIPNAGMGGVNVVGWIGETTVASAGADASIRTWEVTLPA